MNLATNDWRDKMHPQATFHEKVTILAIGLKGLMCLKSIDPNNLDIINGVVIGSDKGVVNDYSREIQVYCESNGLRFSTRTSSQQLLESSRYVVAIGWRWMVKVSYNQELIVFHDSLLPKYRGFNPLVSALINGEKEIGVTCLLGSDEYDRGEIISQYRSKIDYPIKIQEAIELVSEGYASLFSDLLNAVKAAQGLHHLKQNEKEATYSVWRDEEDYRICWQESSNKIKRFIDAVGYPYKGARATLGDQEIIIVDAEVAQPYFVENRGVGKVLFKDGELPTVICGEGLLKINKIAGADGQPLSFPKNFRYRFK
ncbi:MAG: formyltransferase family protein [Imperialibacter sp.]|uniref:formyltransferase family protein n=1 Tax=Imperialibacter sp. TaxID=2038411 RepID=UPI0032EC218C